MNSELGDALLQSPEWSKLSESLDAALLGAHFSSISSGGLAGTDDDGRADALLALLQRFAQDSGHQELIDAPLLFWGFSAGGFYSTAFAARFPDRTLGFVRYETPPALGAEFAVVSKIPALLISGGKEANPLNAPSAQALWNRGRAAGAPWTLAIDPDARHGEGPPHPYLNKANALMVPWIAAVIRQRLSTDGTATLRPVSNASAWMGNIQTAEVAPFGKLSEPQTNANWFPDEASARGWSIVIKPARQSAPPPNPGR
jgi:pimeloyl-ACP methyl ester carboxylesterase